MRIYCIQKLLVEKYTCNVVVQSLVLFFLVGFFVPYSGRNSGRCRRGIRGFLSRFIGLLVLIVV